MSKYKLLSGLAHDVGHSFISLMNYCNVRHGLDGYCMSFICAISRVHNLNEIEIDLMNERISPKQFVLDFILKSVSHYKSFFLDKLNELGISRDEIKSVIMKLVIDYEQLQVIKENLKYTAKISCKTTITLVNGKEYSKTAKGKWLLGSDDEYKELYSSIKE